MFEINGISGIAVFLVIVCGCVIAGIKIGSLEVNSKTCSNCNGLKKLQHPQIEWAVIICPKCDGLGKERSLIGSVFKKIRK